MRTKPEKSRIVSMHTSGSTDEYGLNTLLIEGGRKIISSFLNKNLVDEVYLYTSKNNLENCFKSLPGLSPPYFFHNSTK